MNKRLNRRDALKATLGGVLCTALPVGADQQAAQAAGEGAAGGMDFISDQGERFHLAGDGWALALGFADEHGWRFEPGPLSDEHQLQITAIVEARAREVEMIKKGSRGSSIDCGDVDDEELDLAAFRDEVVHSFFSPRRAGELAMALQQALSDPGFDDRVESIRQPCRRLLEAAITSAPAHARARVTTLVQNFECQDLRGRLEALVAFCRKGGFRMDHDY
jgi:hypothetical protein